MTEDSTHIFVNNC